MSREVRLIPRKDKDIWCGHYLTDAQKKELINQTLKQFDLSLSERLRPFQLIEKVRTMIKK